MAHCCSCGQEVGAEYVDEIPQPHIRLARKTNIGLSITSSAVICAIKGTVRPRAFALLRLITKSNVVDCVTGKSASFAPQSERAPDHHTGMR